MSETPPGLPSATRRLDPGLSAVLRGLRPGQRIRITQTVRVGRKVWPATVTGTFRELNYLATGLSTERAPDEHMVVAAVHFTKDNQELSSVTLDENSKVEVCP